MTATAFTWYRITCNGPGCPAAVFGEDRVTRAALRRDLAAQGWAHSGSDDWCPAHAALAPKAEPAAVVPLRPQPRSTGVRSPGRQQPAREQRGRAGRDPGRVPRHPFRALAAWLRARWPFRRRHRGAPPGPAGFESHPRRGAA